MNITITIDKLKVYSKYSGDIDAFLRVNAGKEKEVFGDDFSVTWYVISNKIQEVELISKRKASQNYTNNVLDELADICDDESFSVFTRKMKFYAAFQQVSGILQEIKSKINAETDTFGTRFDAAAILLKDLDQDIVSIKHCNFNTLNKIEIEFAPTSTYQELSIVNGWSQDYLILSQRFDHLCKEIKDAPVNNTVARKSKPPYLLGLLCLIPLVGAFVGLGLLLYGILKYKDKWLAIIGAAGILWTIFTYSALFYASKHASIFKNGFAAISQKQLNGLVRDIEFYNLQHGHYPDSLQQLLIDGNATFIYDPARGMNMRGNPFYNYKKIGEKYVVFSSGQDGIPNTKDDLYPQITIIDSSKIGLLKTSPK